MIKEALASYANSKAFTKVWAEDRMKTIGASEIGKCAREMYWRKVDHKGIDADFGERDRWGARVRGTVMEDQFWFKAMRKRFGKNLLYAGPKQVTLSDGYLSATPDGLVVNQPRDVLKHLGIHDIGEDCCFAVECKTIDPRVNLTQARYQNAYQAQVQLGLFRTKTKHRPMVNVISYTDASFWDEVMEFPIVFDTRVFQQAHDRAVKIKTATKASELKPEGWIAGGTDCEYCPFTTACGVVRRSVPEEEAAADSQFVAEITDLCREHESIALSIEKSTILLNEKKQEIKDRLRDKKVRRIAKVVVWSSVKGRHSYDNTKIKQAAFDAGVDVEQFSTVGEPTDRLQVLVAPEVLPAIPERVADHETVAKRSRRRG